MIVALAGSCAALVAAEEIAVRKMEQKLLYAGHPGTQREREFLDFLAQHFAQVQATDLASFTPEAAAASDVVLMDYDGDGFKSPRPKLGDSYTRATVTIGVTGAFICDQLRLKTGYM
jgi:hypothetical protein